MASTGIMLDIKPEQINDLVQNAILKSAIGDHIEKAIQKALGADKYGQKSPFQEVINWTVEAIAREMLSAGPLREGLEQKIREKLTEDIMNTAVSTAVKAIKVEDRW